MNQCIKPIQKKKKKETKNFCHNKGERVITILRAIEKSPTWLFDIVQISNLIMQQYLFRVSGAKVLISSTVRL